MEKPTAKERNPSDQIFDDLVDQIANGTFSYGHRLPPEKVLTQKYGVSRNTIRLALNKLSAFGLIETRRGDGSYVRQAGPNVSINSMAPSLIFEQHHLVDILEFRKAIEVYAVRLAALRGTDEDIDKLKALLRRMKKNLHNMDEFELADKEMHLGFARASRNAMFISMLEIVFNVLTKEMSAMLSNQGRDIDSFFYHNAIVDCIEAEKPDEAAYMMEKHLTLVIERIRETAAGKNGG